MSTQGKFDWDPRSGEVLQDQQAAFDTMRKKCPVAHSDFMQWSIFRHEDITRILGDHEVFSNAVSRHLSVPNGMDPPEHTEYRRIVNRYFTPQRMESFEPVCREIVVSLVSSIMQVNELELMEDFALPFAVHVQCAFLGWPSTLHGDLIRWTRKNYEATLARDRQAMSEIAREFQEIIDEMIDSRRQAGAGPEEDITSSLMYEKVQGQPLSNEEIASILRNWTVGEIGTISASVGILTHYLAQHSDLQQKLRKEPSLLPAAIDEILRIHGPLVSSRRVTTRPVEMGGRKIDTGERISLNWISANRDGNIFEDPDSFRLDRDPDKNLLYGAGIHVCPGAPLARLELRVIMEELLKRSAGIRPDPEKAPTNAVYPASGYATLPLIIG